MLPLTPPIRLAALIAAAAATALLVPTDVQLPGTQPLEVTGLGSASTCDNCHGGFDADVEPAFLWRGSTMAHAGRDPLFWATVAIAESDFPGAGDFCIRCHAARGWTEGRSTPTDGSALVDSDADGVECALCHALTDPDGSEYVGVQNPPYLAHDGSTPPVGFHGSGMFVLWGGNEIHGPYSNPVARHQTLQSRFLRTSSACGTCHDVSNPVTGDVAPGNGAMVPLPAGSYSGQLGGPVTGKAAFLVEPHRYGVTERTFSEHASSAFASLRVRDFTGLPEELQDGAIERAYAAATAHIPGGDYADGTPRTFSCQTCHMRAARGKGCDKHNAPVRDDLPLHDLTGANGWVQDAIQWLAQRGRLPIGNRLDSVQLQAMAAAKDRAHDTLESAAALQPVGDVLRVVNLTGHKLLTGYPEGRRLWLHVRWLDRNGALVREDGAYGPMQVQLGTRSLTVESVLDLHDPNLRIYHVEPGISSDWANVLLGVGLPATLPLKYDRVTGAPTSTLGDAAALPPGEAAPSFRFVLNDRVVEDTRIPPYGFAYDDALARSALPVPADQYGDPGPSGIYRHWDAAPLSPPAGATTAELRLLYQPTSWEYVQFLVLANDGSVPNLTAAGQDLLDAWLATGMAAPEEVAHSTWCMERGTREDLELRTEVDDEGDAYGCRKLAHAGSDLSLGLRTPGGAFAGSLAAVLIEIYPTGSPPSPLVPGLWLDRTDLQLTVPGLPQNGLSVSFTLPSPVSGLSLRVQGVALSTAARNGLYATTDAHDVELR